MRTGGTPAPSTKLGNNKPPFRAGIAPSNKKVCTQSTIFNNQPNFSSKSTAELLKWQTGCAAKDTIQENR